jgi:hypothetical protein
VIGPEPQSWPHGKTGFGTSTSKRRTAVASISLLGIATSFGTTQEFWYSRFTVIG